MESTNRYVTGIALIIAIVAFSAFYFLQGTIKTIRNHGEFDLSYSMPRPKGSLYNFIFGLDGREIDRKEINPFKNKIAEQKKKEGVSGPAKAPPKIDPKKTPQAAAAAAAVQKKPEVKVNVVSAEPQSPLTTDGKPAEAPLQSGGMVPQGPAVPQGYGEPKKETDTLSAAQWRSLVLGQPNKENVMKLIAAFNNKEVDAGTLYQIMNDLMQSSNAETQRLGLMIGENVPSLKSFSLVSDNYDKLDGSTKKEADSYLMTYMQGSKLDILALALKSGEPQVVSRAAQVMVLGLEQIKNNPNGNSPSRENNGRGIVAAGTGKKTYTQFIAIFQDLVKSSDSTVAGLAQNALAQIQSLSNT
ncbi:MAG: hypothetical protein ACXWRE_14295 [Pseudobdellovibrionaceae bacterium]